MKTKILLSVMIAFTSQLAIATTITSKSTGGEWSNNATWVGNSAPSSGDDVVIDGNVTVNGNFTCNSLVINGSKTLTINSTRTLTVSYAQWSNAVTNNGSLVFQSGGSNKLSIQSNNWINAAFANNGTFTAATGTVEFKGSSNSLTVSGTVAFYNVICDNIQQMNFGSSCTFGGLVNFKSASATTANGTLSFTNVTCDNVTTMQFSGSNTTINGTLRLNNSTVTGNYPTYAANAVLEINTTTTINGNDYDWPTGNGSNVPSNISIVGGTLQIQGGSRYIKKTLSVASGARLDVGGACFSLPATFTSITNNGTITLGGIDVLSGATWNVNANYTIATLQVENGGTVNANAYALTMNATVNNCNNVSGIMEVKSGGAFNSGTGNVTFIPPYYMPVTGTVNFNNMSVQGSNTINIPAAGTITVSGNLNIGSSSTVNNPGYINFTPVSSVTTNGGQSGVPIPASVPAVVVPAGNSGGGTVTASRWSVLSPNVYSVTSDMTFTGTPKIVTIQAGSEMVIGNNSITCDTVYVYGKVTVNNTNGLSNIFGSAKVVMASSATIAYTAQSGTQTITPRTDYVNLQLSGNSTKNFSSGTYEVTGDFTVTGADPTFDDNTVINFKGAGQAIQCKKFKNVNFAGSGNKTFADTTKISGRLTVSESAVVQSNGLITLQSNASGTAAVGPLTGSADITGNVNYERYIPAGRKWRFLSCPINGLTFSNSWQKQIHITGPGTGGSMGTTNSNGFDWTQSSDPTVYWYNEASTAAMNSKWSGIPNTTTAINPAKGYRVFVRGDRSQGNMLIDGSTYTAQAVTLTASGTLSKGTINVPLTCSNSCGSGDGWNLLSNPYPSAIDWNNSAWAASRSNNISSVIYIFNPNNNQYGSWNPLVPDVSVNGATGYIASGQSFFVKTTGSSTLTFKEDYKAVAPTAGLFGKTSASSNALKIQLGDNTTIFDETVVFTYSTATKGFDDNVDALKPSAGNGSISTYTQSDNTKLVFNAIPPTADGGIDTIPVYAPLGNATYTYTLTFDGIASFSSKAQFILLDAYTGSYIVLTTLAPSYSFSTVANTPGSYAANRFTLLMGNNNSSLPVEFAYFKGNKAEGKAALKWATASEYNNDRFEVERSTDGKNYTTIGTVNGSTNSAKLVEYSFTDEAPAAGVNYYRLKQIDLDGTSSLSSVVSLNFGKSKITSVSVYPTAADDHITVNLNNNTLTSAHIAVIDMFGKTVREESVEVNETAYVHTVQLDGMQTGIYFIEIKQADGTLDKVKFIKK